MSQGDIDVIKGVYEAFGRGDVEAILARVTDDVDWASEPDSTIAPWHGVKRGKAEVAEFFQALAETIEVDEFSQLAFASNDTDVMVVSRFALTVPSTGKRGAMDLHHWFRLHDGKVYHYRGTENTALTAELLRG